MSTNGSNGNGFDGVQIVHTTDEEGQVHVFEKIDEVEVDGQNYALLIYRGTEEEAGNLEELLAAGEDEEDDDEIEEEVVVMKISHEDGLEVYENIEDEAEFEKVVRHIEYLQEEGLDEDDEDTEDFTAELSKLLHRFQEQGGELSSNEEDDEE